MERRRPFRPWIHRDPANQHHVALRSTRVLIVGSLVLLAAGGYLGYQLWFGNLLMDSERRTAELNDRIDDLQKLRRELQALTERARRLHPAAERKAATICR